MGSGSGFSVVVFFFFSFIDLMAFQVAMENVYKQNHDEIFALNASAMTDMYFKPLRWTDKEKKQNNEN